MTATQLISLAMAFAALLISSADLKEVSVRPIDLERSRSAQEPRVGEAKKDAAADKLDADYKVAIEKCDALAGDAKGSCVAAQRRSSARTTCDRPVSAKPARWRDRLGLAATAAGQRTDAMVQLGFTGAGKRMRRVGIVVLSVRDIGSPTPGTG